MSLRPNLSRSGLAFLILAVGSTLLYVSWNRPGRAPRDGPEWTTPYRNARPGVKYVGDGACAECHAGYAREFSRHPMGRSLAPIAAAPPEARAAEDTPELFQAQGFVYGSETRDGRVFHRESRRDSRGKTIGSVEGEVKFVLGSGSRALAFLIDRDGYLFQSPITWYAQSRKWDLAPGYERSNQHLERPVTSYCLYCHANRIDRVPDTLNRYKKPTFQGHAIGCERCHGPGELHVSLPDDAPEAGVDIVNPGKLPIALREDVCRQCHLIGEAGILDQPGRDLFDYRPGLPLPRYERVFVTRVGNDPTHMNSGHVEQMVMSRCYTESRRALGCISCHDPHVLPDPEFKAAYYRDRCLQCHADKGCSLPLPARLESNRNNDCASCHMPGRTTEDVTHLATTIHRITRNRPGDAAPVASTRASRPEQVAFELFDRDAMSPAEIEESKRDLGVILTNRGKAAAPEARSLLERALKAHPDDVEARVAAGYTQAALGRAADGLKEAEQAQALAPDRESSLVAVANLAELADRPEKAVAAWRSAIAVDPFRSEYHAGLATQLARLGQWPEADASALRALQLNPAQHSARRVRIEAASRAGRTKEARAEFETLLEFDPPDRPGLARWFRSLR